MAERRSLGFNVAVNIGARIGLGAVGLVTIPVVLHRLGPEAFGVYMISVSLAGLVGILDLGLTAAFINRLARARNDNDGVVIQGLVGTTISIFGVLGVILCIGTFLVAPVVVTSVLHVAGRLAGDATVALRVTGVGLALSLWLSVLDAIPVAYERYDIVAWRISLISVLAAFATLGYAFAGGGLVGLVVINVIGTAFGLVTFYAAARRLLPGHRLRPGWSKEAMRSLIGFSFFKFAGTASATAVFRFDQLAVGFLLGVRAAGLYAVPSGVLARLLALVGAAVSPAFPRVSGMTRDTSAVSRLFVEATRWLAVIAFPVAAVFAIAPEAILAAWIGGREGQIVAHEVGATTRWLMLAFAVQAVAAVPAVFCEATGSPWMNNLFAVAGLVIHVPMFFVLVLGVGLEGAGLTLLLNSVVQTVPFVILATRRVAEMSVWTLFWRALSRPLVASLIPAAIAIWLANNELSRIWILVVLAAAGLAYGVAAVALGAITRSDLAVIGKLVVPRSAHHRV
ncbi:MAG: oligosaccharide flippase family protein [Candidatus Dormibacteria bacterium]